jgi:hypothetical protein
MHLVLDPWWWLGFLQYQVRNRLGVRSDLGRLTYLWFEITSCVQLEDREGPFTEFENRLVG